MYFLVWIMLLMKIVFLINLWMEMFVKVFEKKYYKINLKDVFSNINLLFFLK